MKKCLGTLFDHRLRVFCNVSDINSLALGAVETEKQDADFDVATLSASLFLSATSSLSHEAGKDFHKETEKIKKLFQNRSLTQFLEGLGDNAIFRQEVSKAEFCCPTQVALPIFKKELGNKEGNEVFFEVSFLALSAAHDKGRYTWILCSEITAEVTELRRFKSEHLMNYMSLCDAQVGAWSFNTTTNAIGWSKSTYQIFGRDEQLPPPSFEEYLAYLFVPEEQKILLEAVGDTLKNATPYEVYHTIKRTDGTIRKVKGIGSLETLSDSGQVMLRGTVIDITEESLNTSRLETLALVAEKTMNAVVITGPDGRIEWVNEGFSLISGYVLSDVIGKKPGAVLQGPATDPQTVQEIREALAAKIGVQKEILNYSRTGRPYWLRLSIEPVFSASGELVKFVAIELDLTERREDEDRLKKISSALEESLLARDRLFAIISHDLRAPFNGFIGLSQILAEDADTMSKEEIKQLADLMQNSATKTLALLEDLLTWAKTQSGELVATPKEISLVSLVSRSADVLIQAIESKELKLILTHDIKRQVMVDENMMSSALQNILSNAIKFTPRQGEIRIGISQVSDDFAELTIQDSGQGMSAEKASSIFEAGYHRSSEGTEGEKGSGLGLLLCKSFIEKNKGTVEVASTLGKGTCFTLRLPLAKGKELDSEVVAGRDQEERNSENKETQGKKILIVDDDEQFHFILKRLLAKMKIDPNLVVSEYGGNGAKSHYENLSPQDADPFALILLDADMADGTGPEFVRYLTEIRRFPNAEGLSVIGMSSRTDKLRALEWRDCGITQFVDKNFSHVELSQLIQEILGNERKEAA